MAYLKMMRPWEGYTKPFRIFGNLYFVGTIVASTHVIDTGSGIILIDPGVPHALYLVLENIRALNLNPYDIKYIVISHGHYDHLGAAKALSELTGAKIFLGRADREYANGTYDLTCAKEIGCPYYESFEPDVLLDEGDIIALGNTSILCKKAPGHTPGTMAFFFDVTDGENTYRAAMHGGVGTNTMRKAFLQKYGLTTELREAFVPAIKRLMNEKVDIHLGNHVENNDTIEKGERITEDYNPFIDSTAWKKFLQAMIEKYERRMREEEEVQ